MSVVKETILDNLSDSAQQSVAKLKEKLELDSEEEAIVYINNILSKTCKQIGISADKALQNISEFWKLAQGFTYYRFGVMSNIWDMWAKGRKVAHMAMIVFISELSAGRPPIAVYEPEDDKGPPFREDALNDHFDGDMEKFIEENQTAIREAIKTIERTKG